MPFTPFHMGLAVTLKSVAGRRFSLMVFGFSQVAMDIEPLVRILRGDIAVHGLSHTYAGATLIGLLSVVVGRPVCQFMLRYWRHDPRRPFMNWLRGPERITWPAAIAGAFVGTYTHVLLDSIMHADLQPFAPLSQANAMLHVITTDTLHLLCVAGAALGFLILVALYLARRGAGTDRPR